MEENKYSWAVNPQKLARAIATAGEGASEEKIRNEYVLIAGKLSDSYIQQMEEKIVPVVENQETTEVNGSETNVETNVETKVINDEETSEPTNDTTIDTEVDTEAEEDESVEGGQDSTNDSIVE